MIDATYKLVGASLGAPDEEALANGASPAIEIVFTIGMALPFAGPDGQPIHVASGNHRYKFQRDEAIKFFESGLEAAKKLPEERKSDIVLANDLGAVNQAAQAIRKVTGI